MGHTIPRFYTNNTVPGSRTHNSGHTSDVLAMTLLCQPHILLTTSQAQLNERKASLMKYLCLLVVGNNKMPVKYNKDLHLVIPVMTYGQTHEQYVQN